MQRAVGPKTVAFCVALAFLVVGCGRGGSTTTTTTGTVTRQQIVSFADVACRRAAQGLDKRFPKTEKNPAPNRPYIKFAAAVSFRKTYFEGLATDYQAYKAELDPIAAAYGDVEGLAQEMLTSAQEGDGATLSSVTDRAEVSAQLAATLAGSFGFKECSKDIPVPRPAPPPAPAA